MLDAARAKAQRGELRISVPIGYLWHREVGLGAYFGERDHRFRFNVISESGGR
jgi:hypothetical protein